MATEDVDYYSVLDVSPTATLSEITTAYRKRSLKVHPDRVRSVPPPPAALQLTHLPLQNPDNPLAAALFHDLRIAADILSDPTQRASFDALLAARNARKLRFAGLDSKRKAMAEDLDRREREFKKTKGEEDVKEREKRGELERLKEEGRRMRESRMGVVQKDDDDERRREADERRRVEREEQSGVVELGPLDMTLKLKWARALRPALQSAEIVQAWLGTLLGALDPEVDSIALSSKFLKDPTKGKYGSGVVAFKSLRAAVRVMEAMETGRGSSEWEGVEVDWAAGSPPAVLGKRPEVKKVDTRSSFPASVSSFRSGNLPTLADVSYARRCWSIRRKIECWRFCEQRSGRS